MPGSAPRRFSPLAAVFLTVVIDLLGFGLVLPLLPLYGHAYGASELVIGLLFASFSATQFLVAPLWGRLSDRIGRRPVLLLGLCGSVAAYTLFGLAPALPAPLVFLFASRIVAGLFAGTIATAYAYIADVTTPEERGRGMALIGAAFGIGFTLGPAIGGLGHGALGPMAPGFIAAAFSATALVFALLRLPEPVRHADAAAAHAGASALRAALGAPTLPTILALVMLGQTCFSLFESTLARSAQERFGFDETDNGWLFSYLGLCFAIAQGFVVRRFMRRVGEALFVVLGTIVLGLGLLAVGHAPSVGLLAAAVPLPVVGFAMIAPSLTSLLSRRTPVAVRGAALGVQQSASSLSRIVGPVVGLALLGAGLRLPYVVGAGAMLLALLLAVSLLTRRDPGAEDVRAEGTA
jgi:MFS family permease